MSAMNRYVAAVEKSAVEVVKINEVSTLPLKPNGVGK